MPPGDRQRRSACGGLPPPRDHDPAWSKAREMFHRLWAKAVGRNDYDKGDWKALRDEIYRMTGEFF